MGKTSQNRSHVNSPVDEPCEARPQGEGVSPSQRLQELKALAEGIAVSLPSGLPELKERFSDWVDAFSAAACILKPPTHGSYANVRLVKKQDEVRIGWIGLSPTFNIICHDVPVTLEAIQAEVREAVPRMVGYFLADLQNLAQDLAKVVDLAMQVDALKKALRQLEEEISDC